MDIPKRIPSNGHGLDHAGDHSGLIETVLASQDLDAPVTEQLVPGLLERERAVFDPFSECRWPLYVALEKRFPAEIEPIGDGLNALTPDSFPVWKSTIAKFGEMSLQFSFRQRLAKQLVVASMESDRAIPNLRRDINRSMQMLKPLRLEKLELEGLTQGLYCST